MKSKSVGNFSQKSTRWRWPWSKMHWIEKLTPLTNIFFTWKQSWQSQKVLVSQSAVGFLIRCILDYAQHHLVDFWKKRPANFNFIWLEWNSYNSSIQFHIVWSRSSIFKLKSSPAQGCSSRNEVFVFTQNS